MAQEKVSYELKGTIGHISLNRPEKLNALEPEMLATLRALLERIEEEDETCRVLLLSAAGGKAFCAGADIEAWKKLSPTEMWRQWTRRGHKLFSLLEELRVPTIALVDGIAYGGGLELALACDMILATEHSRFAFPEVSIGTIPGWGGTVRLPERVGIGRAKYMMYTADPIGCSAAYEWGLVEEILSDREKLQERGEEVAMRIAGNSPVSVQATKQLLRNGMTSRNLMSNESLAGGFAAFTPEAAEGLAAFTEKRPPQF